jgi:acyl-CoA dehydrogenase
MQISPVPTLDPEINETRAATANIVNRYIIPNEDKLGDYRNPESQQLRREIQDSVKKAGLWAPHLPKEYGGMGVGFMRHAYMNEVLAWSPYSNPLFGVVAPDSGNQTILIKYGTDEQKKKWLEPLIAGEIRSCFSMTEPDAPGSNPYAIQTRAARDGDEWVINGRKWFTSGAVGAAFAIVMCRTEEVDGEGGVREKMTQIIVPTDTPGFNIVRRIHRHCDVAPYDHSYGRGHRQRHGPAHDHFGPEGVRPCSSRARRRPRDPDSRRDGRFGRHSVGRDVHRRTDAAHR